MEVVDVRYLGSDGQYQTYSPTDLSLINKNLITPNFGAPGDYIEYFIKDQAGVVLSSNYYDTKYDVGDNPSPITGTTTTLLLDPESDAKQQGYNRGIVNVKYNFFKKHLLSAPNPEQNFWIKEISTSRTEIKVARQDLSNSELLNAFGAFNSFLAADTYYPDFLLNFGVDIQVIGVNAVYVEEEGSGYIIFKLYEPLPLEFDVKSTFWVVTTVADPAEFNVSITLESPVAQDFVQISGPNFKVGINDTVNQTTPYYNYTSLFATSLSSSYQQLRSMMDERGIQINVDYSDFANFVHFSSATERVYNFVYKLQQIETASLGLLQTNTTQARILLQAQIDNIIQKFDGYEYYLYFESESFAWPKITSTQPYVLTSVTSSEARAWLGSPSTLPNTVSASIYYSASLYDDTNSNLLIYTTPQYIRDDEQNAPYLVFLNMIGQHFDNIWVYLKDVTNRYEANNNPFVGISMDQVANALKSFGIKLYTNTSISDNIYYSLLGINPNGSLLPPTGSELITTYVTSSIPTLPGDQITAEIYKRLYHNLAYLLKTRGTERGIRALATTFGIPHDVLPPLEFGGYNIYEIAGIQSIDPQKITTGSILQISSSLLNPFTTIQYFQNDTDKSSNTVQAGFSPADSINASITSSGFITGSTPNYFNIMQYIGAPELQYSSSYIPLVNLSNTFFSQSYTGNPYTGLQRYNVWDFIRVIKYYNNSFFKMVRDWAPARASMDSGIVIKSHLLERNKYPRKEPTGVTSSYESDYYLLAVSGGAGGAVTGSTAFTQSVPVQYGNYSSPLSQSFGTVYVVTPQFLEQYTGEFSGSYIDIPNEFSQVEESSYIYPWTSSVAPSQHGGRDIMFLTYSLSPIFQNVTGAVISQRFLDLDYNQTQLAPVNLNLVTQSINKMLVIGPVSQSAQPYSQYAPLQDYNYSLRPSVIQKYSGSYLSGLFYNTFTTASVTYSGDISYGQSPVINYYTNRIGFFTQISQSSFLPGKTNVTLAYFADVSGGLFELNQNNKNWVDVQNTFKAGTTATIKQFDNKKYTNQVSTDGVKAIYNSGYNYSPQLYFTSGADGRLYFQYVGSDVESPFRGFVSGSPNAFISGAASPNYLVILDPATTTRTGKIYNYLDGENPSSADFATGSTTSQVWPSFTASLAGQRTFTVNLGINVEFPNPQTFGSNNIQFSWGAYKNGLSLIGSLQTVYFQSQYSLGGTTGSIVARNPVSTITELTPTGPETTVYGPFDITINGGFLGTIGDSNSFITTQYFYFFEGTQSRYELLSTNASTDVIIAGITTVDYMTPPSILLSTPTAGGAGGTPVNISSTQLNLNTTTAPVNLTPGDTVEFRLKQDFVSTNNYTASFVSGSSNSYLTSQVVAVGQGGYPYASTGSAAFIESIVDTTPLTSAITFNTELSSFTGYQFVPAFASGGVLYTSSLYTTYGDVYYPLNPQFGDKIVMSDFSGIIQELDVVSSAVANGRLSTIVTPQVLDNWMVDPKQIFTFLLLRRYEDEQNVILSFTKAPGPTSYGFLLANTVSPQITNNINTLQAAVQSQLLSLQSDPLIEKISGGSFGGG
jgi:hypothetical protein